MNKKAIFFDIDGTLIDCQNGKTHLSKKTIKALYKLKNAGHYLFIATGRPYCYLLQELKDFQFDGYILNDGALILLNNEEYIKHPIEIKRLDSIINQVIEKNKTYVAYAKEYAFFYNDDGSLLNYCHHFMIDDQYVQQIKDLNEIKEDIYKIHVQSRNKRDYEEFTMNYQDFCVSCDDQHYLREIYSTHHSKATALIEVLKKLNVPIEKSYFFGDGFNDIQMMDTVGNAIAMGNAHESVKSHADYICKSIEEDGVADFILHSGLFFNDK